METFLCWVGSSINFFSLNLSTVCSIFGLLGFACIITSFIFAITKSQPGTNKYGPNPYELKTNVVLEPTTPSVPPEQAV